MRDVEKRHKSAVSAGENDLQWDTYRAGSIYFMQKKKEE